MKILGPTNALYPMPTVLVGLSIGLGKIHSIMIGELIQTFADEAGLSGGKNRYRLG